jgi:myo-inositol-1(or 4)-monophosphatase
VALGQFGAVASHEARPWDEAAAGLILREAGGHWRSRADWADWSAPAALMAIPAQQSLGCHPSLASALAAALAGLVAP